MRRDLLRCLFAALLLAIAGIGTVSALDWQIETVDPTAYAGTCPSLALDDAGNPRISYTVNNGLRYAAWNGTGWEVRAVDPVVSVGGTSLALDAGGTPRIAYYDNTNKDLRYAAWDGSAWRIETVDSDGTVGPSASLTLDGAGYPRISYMDATNRTVRYAAFDGSAWRVETVDQVGVSSSGTSLELDGAGAPRICYIDGHEMTYAAYNGTAWRIETMGSGASPSLALDRAGTPRIASVDPSSTGLLYRVRDGPDWRIEWIDRGVIEWDRWTMGQLTSLALDAAGKPRISYHDATDHALKYAAYNASSWQWDTGTVGPGYYAGTPSSLALDAAGNPRIAYYAGYSDYGLKYARADVPRPSVLAVPGGAGLPTATDGDDVCDDVNGNGRKDFADIILFFGQMSWIAANEPVPAFDCNGNGRIDFADVVWLYDHLDTPARKTFTVTAAAIGPGTIQPSGHLTVREGENVTFTLHVGPGVVTPHDTQSGEIIGNEVVVDPVAMPTLHPRPTSPYPWSANFTSSYTLRDVRANHTVYGVFYRAGWITC